MRHSAPPTEKPKGGKNKAVIIILVVLIVAAVAAGIYVVKFSGLVDGRENTTQSASSVNYTVPDFVSAGYTQSDIKNNGAWNKQFSITYDAQYSDKAAEGVIIAQSVKKGESVAQGTQIVLTVSKGIQTEEVPDVGGLDVAEAKKQLEAKGFKVTTVTVYNDGSYKEGTVKSVYGMTPDAKSTAAVGSEVVLQVYGAEQTTTEPESTTKPETTVQEVQ